MEGYDAGDPASRTPPADAAGRPDRAAPGDVRGLRVGVPSDWFREGLEPEVQDAFGQALDSLGGLGLSVRDLPALGWGAAVRANGVILLSDAAALYGPTLRAQPDQFGPDVAERLRRGLRLTGTDVASAQHERAVWRRAALAVFDEVDIVAVPTAELPAPVRVGLDGVEAARRLTRLTSPFNLLGWPAVSVPCGASADGLPIGLQLVARPWADGLLLDAAAAFEAATSWTARSPR
jgi:aspartyl-tRNA(Asn)/glutamyl-tRNA(Gln) amidotransferase subunit A